MTTVIIEGNIDEGGICTVMLNCLMLQARSSAFLYAKVNVRGDLGPSNRHRWLLDLLTSSNARKHGVIEFLRARWLSKEVLWCLVIRIPPHIIDFIHIYVSHVLDFGSFHEVFD